MEKLFITLSMVLLCFQLQAQTILLQEDFSTASGTNPPAGWTVQTAVGDPLIDVWHFDNPGRRSPIAPIAGNFACFDSDKLSNNGLAEEVYLTSPAFNATTTDNIILEFDQYFMSGFGAGCIVEVFNGISWVSVYTNSSTSTNPQHSTFDITTFVQNKTNTRLRFKWTGNYSWFWLVDNIKIATPVVIAEQFTEQTSIILSGVQDGSVAWGDYDNDGDLDILLTGGGGDNISKIYRNNGDNSFKDLTEISLEGVSSGSSAWGDYDKDGDLDILLTGHNNSGVNISKIYRNNGDNSFTKQTSIVLTGVSSGSVAWGDYDNDGDLDILLTGYSGSDPISKIYSNNGNNSFTEQIGISLIGVYNGSVAWGDYDYDGDLDILLTGLAGSAGSVIIPKIYRNNGDNSFTEQTGISLPGISYGSVGWGDYDNDGDLDILLTGYSSPDHISKIFRNNGNNSFAEQTGIALTGVEASCIAWGDYDNDGDLDILLTGYSGTDYVSKIYRNNGDNSFSEQTGIVLDGVINGSVVWGDYDNDSDLDILLTGNGMSKIYRNNNTVKNILSSVPGNLNAIVNNQKIQFSWDKATDSQTPQAGLSYNIVIGKTPGECDIATPMSNTVNGFRKVVQAGNRSSINAFTFNSSLPAGTYYWGVQAIDHAFAGSPFATGTFTISVAQAANLKFTDITTESLKISWTRGNKEKCVVFMKQDSTGLPVLQNNITYTADTLFAKGSQSGEGWYCVFNGIDTSVNVTGLYGSTGYKIMVIEYSGEPGQEIYLTASNSTNPQTCYTQEQFTEQIGITQAGGVYQGPTAWGDYDNDGDLDILLTTRAESGGVTSNIYRNNSGNTFTEQPGISFPGITDGSFACGDYDNDNDLDIILLGFYYDLSLSENRFISKIFRNTDGASFNEQIDLLLTNVWSSSADWGDYNNDGHPDIILTCNGYPKIYRNNGENNFTEHTGILNEGSFISANWCDYDNDGDLDIIIGGNTKIYRNNGDNSFTNQTIISLPQTRKIACGDYDSDGYMDILLTGFTGSTYYSKVYRNNGNNTFTEQTGIALTGVKNGSIEWGDYDNDGDLDIILTGVTPDDNLGVSKIYRNNGNNTFTEQAGFELTGVTNSSVAWGDYDNDGDLDILLTGDSGSKIYKNNQFRKNTMPDLITGIQAHLIDKSLVISWDKSFDQETPQSGLTYNLRVSTTQGGCEILSPMSLPEGKRTIPAFGNVGHNTKWTIDLSGHIPLPEHIYYSVQAIDNGFLAGEWSPEKSEISDFVADFVPYTTCQKTQTQFQDKSYSILYPITIFKWKFTEGLVVTTSSLQNPGYTFQTAGTHQVELTITNSSGATTSRMKTVTVLQSPLSDFNATTVCQGVPIIFDNTTDPNTTTIESWLWDFGDNTIKSTIEEPGTHGYLNPGEYTVKLFATAGNGCSGSIQKTVSVITLPVAAISANAPLTFCTGDSVTLSTGINPDYSYKWMLNGTAITNAVSNSFIAKQPGIYTVEVVNTAASCAKTSNPVTVTTRGAPASPSIYADGATELCQGDSVTLSVTNITGNTYQWKLNGGAIGSNSNQFVAKNAGSYTVTVSNSNSCSVNSANSITITVYEPPRVPSVSLNGPAKICEGDSLVMSVPLTTGHTYQWLNAFGPITGKTGNNFSAKTTGQYSLQIFNEKGCQVGSSPINVTVTSLPSLPIIITENYQPGKCNIESPITIKVDQPINGFSYQWKRNGIPLEKSNLTYLEGFLSMGEYTVEVNNEGCKNESRSQSIFFENALEKPFIYAQGSTVWYLACSNDSASQYKWYYNGTLIHEADKYLYVANQNHGNYYVSISNSKGCFTASDEIKIPTSATGIDDTDPFDGLKIYPNPTTGLLTIEMDNQVFGELDIKIFSQEGKNILNIKAEKTTEHFSGQFDLSGQPEGIYIINLIIDKYMVNRKVIVE